MAASSEKDGNPGFQKVNPETRVSTEKFLGGRGAIRINSALTITNGRILETRKI